MSTNMGVTPQDKPLSVSGRNWGDAELDGMMYKILMLRVLNVYSNAYEYIYMYIMHTYIYMH